MLLSISYSFDCYSAHVLQMIVHTLYHKTVHNTPVLHILFESDWYTMMTVITVTCRYQKRKTHKELLEVVLVGDHCAGRNDLYVNHTERKLKIIYCFVHLHSIRHTTQQSCKTIKLVLKGIF